MAILTKTYTENQESSYKSTWTLTITGTNATASGSTTSVPAPSISAKYVNANKNGANAYLYSCYFYANGSTFGLDGQQQGVMDWELFPSSWASNAAKTLTRVGVSSVSVNTSVLFNANNKTSKTVDVYLRKASSGDLYLTSFYGEDSRWNAYLTTAWIEFGVVSTVTLNAPPTFSSTQVSFTNDYSGDPYAGLTTASVTISSLSAKYGGDISSAVLKIGSQTASRTTNGTLSILLNAVGTFVPTVTVTDSRGQVTTVTLNAITVKGYVVPSVSFEAERTTSTGAPNDEGTYAVISPTFTFTDAIATLSAPAVGVTDDGGVARTPTVTWYSTRAADGTLSGSVTWASLSSGDKVYGLVSITNGFNTQKSYQISVTPQDSEDTGTAITQTLAGAFYTVDFLAGGHGIAFGQPASEVGFFCDMDTTFKDDVFIDLPDYQTASTTDKAIYDAVVALGWDSDVLVN